jgi:thioredoxin 1
MNKAEFQQKISATSKPVILDCWAPWCAPCMMTKPILEKLAREYADSVEFMPVNADDSRELLEFLSVRGIPTVLTLRKGKEVGRVTGAQNEANYRLMFEALAEGREVKVPLAPFDRMLRLFAGALLVLVGVMTSNWLIGCVGGFLALMGIYDRYPVLSALARMLKRK